ncbi:alpha-L-fucosidase [Leptobacterium flavescens]|uniref:alpha-L-fucosidase n=1 Tax=Leptobacterium flavescens TaxID=472055 RepID=A0A6P0UTJ4_9FLAO|nr:alpha-L-fucosidase [Leptobacterium flavescens]NER14173.1 alpha-L-fucosidase [Leptobacterium flavescens]
MKKPLQFYNFLFLIVILLSAPLKAQDQSDSQRMKWFKEAKLGIFIHWGIYSVNGIDESWSFFNGYISYEDYMKQLSGFTARKYDPEYWAGLIKESGARYAVLTTKHHDGFALWDSKWSELDVRKTKARKDLVKPFAEALRQQGLKVGLYFSLLDWSHPDYPNFLRNEKRYETDPVKWQRFVKFNFDQLKELSVNYRPDLYWFDGDWEQSAEQWKAKELSDSLRQWNPNVILNSRIRGYGDYATPEQGLPVSRPKDKYWELCMTTNDSWGYQHNDHNYKSANQIIRIFVDCIGLGGNLLLGIGPKADGTIPEEQEKILKSLGKWTKKHEEAIYNTRAGVPAGHFYGPTTLSADRKILYLFLDHRPNGPIVIKGLKNKINRIRVVGNGTKLSHKIVGKQYWSDVPGLLYIDVPENSLDKDVSVIALQLDGEISLYREDGQVIECN